MIIAVVDREDKHLQACMYDANPTLEHSLKTMI